MSNLSFIFFMIGEQGSQISTFFVIIFGKASAELQGGMKSLLLHLCFPVVQPYWELKPVPTQNPVVQGGHGVLGSLLLPKQTWCGILPAVVPFTISHRTSLFCLHSRQLHPVWTFAWLEAGKGKRDSLAAAALVCVLCSRDVWAALSDAVVRCQQVAGVQRQKQPCVGHTTVVENSTEDVLGIVRGCWHS